MTYNPGSDDAADVPMVRRVVEVHYRCPMSGARLASNGLRARQVRCPTCERAVDVANDVLSDHGRVCFVEVVVPKRFDAAEQDRARADVLDAVAKVPNLPNSYAPLRTWLEPTVVWPWLEGA